MARYAPRQEALCQILARMGGKADSQSEVYMQLNYKGGSSNNYGSRALNRAMASGLIELDRSNKRPGNRVPVQLTDAGWEVAGR